MNWKNLNVLIISPEKWDHIWVSKHHYALELSKLGAKVWFLNPPEKIWSETKYYKNLNIISYRHQRGLNRLPHSLRDIFTRKIINKINKYCGIKSWNIVWSFDPFRFQNCKLFKADFTIYFQADRHKCFEENILIETADLSLTVSSALASHTKQTKPIHVIGHGLPSKFNIQLKKGNQLNRRLKVGYAGNFYSSSLDHQLLKKVISKFQNLDFHFAGPINNQGKEPDVIEYLTEYKNVYFHGKLMDTLPAFLQAMDILLLFYKEKNGRYPSNSHKILEYLSSGKIILSLPIEDYQNKPSLVVIANSHEEYLIKLEDIISGIYEKNFEANAMVRRNYALKYLYGKRLNQISNLLDQI